MAIEAQHFKNITRKRADLKRALVLTFEKFELRSTVDNGNCVILLNFQPTLNAISARRFHKLRCLTNEEFSVDESAKEWEKKINLLKYERVVGEI